MAANSDNENLKREIGIRSLTLGIINGVVGTGIFVLPAIVAMSLGTAAIIAYLICGFLVFLIALCFAEVGSKISRSGGVYAYIETAFGTYAGFLANNLYWVGACVLAEAALANAFANTLKYFFPILDNEISRISILIFVFGILALLNIRSVKLGVRFMEIVTAAKIIPLIILVIAGIGFVSAKNLQWNSTPTMGNFGAASLLLFFAFMGMETPLSYSGEIKNTRRTIPISIALGISCVLVLYISIQLITQGVLGLTISMHKDSPLGAVAGVIFGRVGIALILITTAISMLGILAGDLLAIPRILYAGARDGLLPGILAKVHPRFSTPYISVMTYSSLALVIAIFGGFRQLAILASASTLLIYLGVVLATLKLRNQGSPEGEKSFRVPGGPIVPLLAICVIIWLLTNLSKKELTGIVIFLAVLSLIYLLRIWWRRKYKIRPKEPVIVPEFTLLQSAKSGPARRS
jgi:APA family basic amino acid/polyamine antiporter